MTEQIENKELSGDVEIPNQRVHNFSTLQAMCDFITVFKIENARYGTGFLSDGRKVVQLIYQTNEN